MNVLKSIDVPGLGKKYSGKVRDVYVKGEKRILIATDRISAFDMILGHIPYRGAVLTELSEFWFEKTKNIVENHMIKVIDPNVMIGKNCQLIPIEVVVRGYISGVTNTSIWGSYEKGDRVIYGVKFPDGLKKNQKLPKAVITPTTKAESGHDLRLTKEDIIKKKIVSEKIYSQMEKAALSLFEFGSKWCEKHGLILVDTKYEFGLYNNKLVLIDEIHTPDSSRFWIKKTYADRFKKGQEPDNFDKEFMRLWYAKRVDPYKDKIPAMPDSLAKAVSKKYIDVYEMLTGKKFKKNKYPIEERIKENIKRYLSSQT